MNAFADNSDGNQNSGQYESANSTELDKKIGIIFNNEQENNDGNIHIKGQTYTPEEFERLLDESSEIYDDNQVQNKIAPAVAPIFAVPGIGEVAFIGTGIVVAGVGTFYAGSKIYETANVWFSKKSEKAKKDIPTSLINNDNGKVDLGKFTKNVKGKSEKEDPKSNYTKDKDNTHHGGGAWKIKNKKGERVATVDETGKVLRY